MQVPPPQTNQAKSINFNNVTLDETDSKGNSVHNYAADSKIEGIITLKGGEWTVDANNGKVSDATGAEVSVTNRLKSNGNRTMEIDLTGYTGQVKLQFFVRTGKNEDLTRGVKLESSDGTKVGELMLTTKDMSKFEVTVTGGSVYTLSTITNGVNFYGINVIPVA